MNEELLEETIKSLNFPDSWTSDQKRQMVQALVAKINEQFVIYLYQELNDGQIEILKKSADKGEDAYYETLKTLKPDYENLYNDATTFVINKLSLELASSE